MCEQSAEQKFTKCGFGYDIDLRNGYSLFQECDFPTAYISINNKELHFERCIFHLNDEIIKGENIDGFYKDEVFAEIEKIKSETISRIFEADYDAGDFSRLGTRDFPISNHKFKRIHAVNLRREEPLFIEGCAVEGPIFFKNCEFSTISLGLTKGNILTLTNCRISRINLNRSDFEPEEIYLNNTKLKALYSDVHEYGSVKLEYSEIEKFYVEKFAPFRGLIVSILSKLNFHGGDFSSATVGVSDRISFSLSVVHGCRFTTANFDEWRRLKLTYNQNSSFFAVLLFVAFLLPVAFDIAYWQSVAGLQDAINKAGDVQGVFEVSSCLAERCEEVSLLWLVAGGNQGIFYVLMTAALLVLNVLRIILVSECAIIREWENQAGLYPKRGTILPTSIRKHGSEGDSLGKWRLTFSRLIPLDRIVRFLVVVSLLSFVMNLWKILQANISIPV